jgi:hypothetical protein
MPCIELGLVDLSKLLVSRLAVGGVFWRHRTQGCPCLRSGCDGPAVRSLRTPKHTTLLRGCARKSTNNGFQTSVIMTLPETAPWGATATRSVPGWVPSPSPNGTMTPFASVAEETPPTWVPLPLVGGDGRVRMRCGSAPPVPWPDDPWSPPRRTFAEINEQIENSNSAKNRTHHCTSSNAAWSGGRFAPCLLV